MRLRVKATATAGHQVHGRMIMPGEELPGEYPRVPALMDWKLEEVPAAPPKVVEIDASTLNQKPGTTMIKVSEPERPAWYAALAKELDKDEPSKADLRDYAEMESIDLPREPAAKSELIEAISAVKGG